MKRNSRLWAMLFFLALATSASARAGRCRGEVEKTVLYLEYLSRQADILVDRFFWSVNILPRLRRSAPELARVIFAFQARQIVARSLSEALPTDAGLLEKVIAQLWPHYQKTVEVLGLAAEAAAAEKLRQTAGAVFEGYFFCRAAAQREPAWCAFLGDEKNRRDCPRFLVSFSLLSGDCGPQTVDEFSRVWGARAEIAQAFCQALKQGRPDLCPQAPEAEKLCRALVVRSEDGCRDQGDDQAKKMCRQLLHTINWLKGEAPPPELLQDDPYPWMILGWLGPERCLSLALEWWDRAAGFPFALASGDRPK